MSADIQPQTRGERLRLDAELVIVEMVTVTDSGIDLIVRRPSGALEDRTISADQLAAVRMLDNDGQGETQVRARRTLGPVDATQARGSDQQPLRVRFGPMPTKTRRCLSTCCLSHPCGAGVPVTPPTSTRTCTV